MRRLLGFGGVVVAGGTSHKITIGAYADEKLGRDRRTEVFFASSNKWGTMVRPRHIRNDFWELTQC